MNFFYKESKCNFLGGGGGGKGGGVSGELEEENFFTRYPNFFFRWSGGRA